MDVSGFPTICPSTIAQRQAWTVWKGVTSQNLTLHVISETQEVESTTTIGQAANAAVTTEQARPRKGTHAGSTGNNRGPQRDGSRLRRTQGRSKSERRRQRPFQTRPTKSQLVLHRKARLEHTPNQRKEEVAKATEQEKDKPEANEEKRQAKGPVKEDNKGAPRKAKQTTEENNAKTHVDPPPKNVQSSTPQDPITNKEETTVPKAPEQDATQRRVTNMELAAALQELAETEKLVNEKTKELELAETTKRQAEDDIRQHAQKDNRV